MTQRDQEQPTKTAHAHRVRSHFSTSYGPHAAVPPRPTPFAATVPHAHASAESKPATPAMGGPTATHPRRPPATYAKRQRSAKEDLLGRRHFLRQRVGGSGPRHGGLWGWGTEGGEQGQQTGGVLARHPGEVSECETAEHPSASRTIEAKDAKTEPHGSTDQRHRGASALDLGWRWTAPRTSPATHAQRLRRRCRPRKTPAINRCPLKDNKRPHGTYVNGENEGVRVAER